MMKKVAIPLVLALLIFPAGAVTYWQKPELAGPGITPAWGPIYAIDRWLDNQTLKWAATEKFKAKKHLEIAEERLAEYEVMEKKGPYKYAKLVEEYEEHMNKTQACAKRATERGKNTTELYKNVEEATSRHLRVLRENLERVPDRAKPAIGKAILESTKGHLTATYAVKEMRRRRSPRWAKIEKNVSKRLTEKKEELGKKLKNVTGVLKKKWKKKKKRIERKRERIEERYGEIEKCIGKPHPMCVGHWTIENGKCKWVCARKPKPTKPGTKVGTQRIGRVVKK